MPSSVTTALTEYFDEIIMVKYMYIQTMLIVESVEVVT